MPTEYIYCAYSNFTLQNDLHFELFEAQWYSSRWLEAISQQVFWKDDILVSAHAVKEVKQLKSHCTVRDMASWFWTRRGFLKKKM